MSLKSVSVFIFLVAISSVLTAFTDLLVPIKLPYKEWYVAAFLEVIFIFLVFIKYEKLLTQTTHLKLFLIFYLPIFLLYALEPLRHIINGGKESLLTYVAFLNHLIFIVFIGCCNVVNKNFLTAAIQIYIKFCFFIIWATTGVFILLHLGVLNIESWGLPSFFGTGFYAKFNVPGAIENIYSVPLYISVIFPNYIKPFGFFAEFGTFAGLSYEPHVAAFFLTPAFFLSFRYFPITWQSVITRYLPFILFYILSFSLTNIISLLCVGLFYLVITAYKPLSALIIVLAFSLATLVYFFVINFIGVDLELLFYIESKMESRSGEESVGFLSYLAAPKSMFGFGAFNIPTYYGEKFNDIGLITAMLYLVFYLSMLWLIVKCTLKKNIVYSLAGLYFILHSLKFPLHMIQYLFPLFILYIMIGSAYGKGKDMSFEK